MSRMGRFSSCWKWLLLVCINIARIAIVLDCQKCHYFHMVSKVIFMVNSGFMVSSGSSQASLALRFLEILLWKKDWEQSWSPLSFSKHKTVFLGYFWKVLNDILPALTSVLSCTRPFSHWDTEAVPRTVLCRSNFWCRCKCETLQALTPDQERASYSPEVGGHIDEQHQLWSL